MSARFVSTGAIDTQTGDAVAPPAPQPSSASSTNTTATHKNDEWAAVQAQLETERQAREAKRKAVASGESGGRSLYEVLEANKAAKQAAFEEANKIRNQFRALDEDEIGFLEEVEARKREEAERGRRELEEGLRVFREARKGERNTEEDVEGEVVEGGWRVGGKRKRKKGDGEVAGLLKGVKRRVSGGGGGGGGDGAREGLATKKTGEEDGAGERERKLDGKAVDDEAVASAKKKKEDKETVPRPTVKISVTAAAAAPAPKPKLGLVAYGSDDDSD